MTRLHKDGEKKKKKRQGQFGYWPHLTSGASHNFLARLENPRY